MRSIRCRARIGILGALAAFSVLVAAGSASASTGTSAPSLPTLNGFWAPFNRCPVESPAMKAADGNNKIALCLASDSPSGTFKAGNVPVATGDTNLQLAVVANNAVSPETFTPIQPVGGAVVAAPVHTPGGFLALACPSSTPPLSNLCNSAARDPSLNDVQAIVQDAGNPSNLNVLAGAGVGQVIVTLPIKIKLDSPLLGGQCSIGSDANPIVLNIANTTAPTFSLQSFDANGTPDPNGVMGRFFLPGATQGDSTFAVPAATDCGPGGTADATINSRLGLPSPSGNNNLVLNNATSYLTGFNNPSSVAPNDGKLLAMNWHLATLP